MYQTLIKPLLFSLPPEKAHHLTMRLLKTLVRDRGTVHRRDREAGLSRKVWGLDFPNPVGLAAGFDKNAELVDQWGQLGFGFVEVGTVTPRSQPGNPQPRLFRLPDDRALINRMGFNNDGVEAIAERLAKRRSSIIVGGNIGKNKTTPNEQAADDYEKCFVRLFDLVDYFVVNVSSPNTPGLRELQEKEPLQKLLAHLQSLNQQKPKSKPLLLKIAPDLSEAQLDDIVEISREVGLDGLIATNTTISREGLLTPEHKVSEIGAGGLSGRPMTDHANQILGLISHKTQSQLPLIGVGGIHEPFDALQKLKNGASLIQLYTGFVYGGVPLIRAIKRAILEERG